MVEKKLTNFNIQEQIKIIQQMRENLENDPNFLPSYKDLKMCLNQIEIQRKKIRTEEDYDNSERKNWDKLINKTKQPFFEFLTKEYIDSFGSYIAKRVEELGGTEQSPITILEVGAGDGRLTNFLQKKTNEICPKKVKFFASDKYDSSSPWDIKPVFPVEQVSHEEALKKYNPKIVIFSWIPHNFDCTDSFRATKNVDEYILIGEEGGGCCGDAWKTWGIDEYSEHKKEIPPYEVDGFKMIEHKDLSKLQLSRINITQGENTSTTVSFKRKS